MKHLGVPVMLSVLALLCPLVLRAAPFADALKEADVDVPGQSTG